MTSTGQVLVSTTNGTNTIHGQLFYQFQDHRALFGRAQNGQDPQFQRNQFGGSVGGPILKDKLFFFGNSERIKQDSASVSPVSTGTGSLFSAIQARYPVIATPYRETYSVVRLDYNGPKGIHFFARANYNVNSVASNYNLAYSLYANRDNTPGIAGGADFATGKFTHSFRGSYEKFHNLISDASNSPSLYNPLNASVVGGNGLEFYYNAQHLFAGPNYLAPQGTFQSDKQFRYDGSWTKGAHNIRYGGSVNRILGGGFAAFFGLGPRVSINSSSLFSGPTKANPMALGCGAVAGAAPCPSDPLQGYSARTAIIGNGQGSFTEKPGFNLPGSGVFDWRSGAYVQDSWKVTPRFTLNAGVRWSVDTQRANQDIAMPTCGDVDVSSVGQSPCAAGTTASTPLPSLWNSAFSSSHTHQPYGNFGPQFSFVFAPGQSQRNVFRGGIGIFYESDVFNNTTNARTSLIKSGAFFDDRTFCSGGGTYSVTLPDGTKVNSVNGVSLTTLCNSTSLGNAAKSIVQLQHMYQANTVNNSSLANGGFLGETLNAAGAYAAPYRTPYATQFNFGVQRELFKGAVLSADYVHNGTVHISESVDQNHIGAARYLNVAAATNAINATAAAYPACTTAASTQAKVACAIANGAQIGDFAGNGLDSGMQYQSGYNSYYSLGVDPSQGTAFAGKNPLLGYGSFLLPIGRSGYDALQVLYHQSTMHPAPGIAAANLQIGYSLSRIVSTFGNANSGGADQFFSSTAADNDDPNQFIGRTGLDHKHEVTMGGVITLKYGPRIGLVGHFFSAPPTSLTLDASNPTGGIFTSDITGDGTIGDLAPGTAPGDYMHRIKPNSLRSYITGFNANYANRVTPAGQALISAGLFTQAQLTAIGAVVQNISQLPQATALANPTTRTFDANFSYPIPLAKYREGLSLEPAIVFYNVANLANFNNNNSGVLLNTSSAASPADPTGTTNQNGGYLSGINSYGVVNSNRIQRGSGTFNQGAVRTTEFQLKLNF